MALATVIFVVSVFYSTENWLECIDGSHPDDISAISPVISEYFQRIHFVILTGSLSLDYPGFYRPICAAGAWTFFFSFLGKNGTYYRNDGIYIYTQGTTWNYLAIPRDRV